MLFINAISFLSPPPLLIYRSPILRAQHIFVLICSIPNSFMMWKVWWCFDDVRRQSISRAFKYTTRENIYSHRNFVWRTPIGAWIHGHITNHKYFPIFIPTYPSENANKANIRYASHARPNWFNGKFSTETEPITSRQSYTTSFSIRTIVVWNTTDYTVQYIVWNRAAQPCTNNGCDTDRFVLVCTYFVSEKYDFRSKNEIKACITVERFFFLPVPVCVCICLWESARVIVRCCHRARPTKIQSRIRPVSLGHHEICTTARAATYRTIICV